MGARRSGAADALREEFLGREVLVVAHSDPALVGRSGEVLDETMKTFVVAAGPGGNLRVAKRSGVFRFRIDGRDEDVPGDRILFRPEDRIKKVR